MPCAPICRRPRCLPVIRLPVSRVSVPRRSGAPNTTSTGTALQPHPSEPTTGVDVPDRGRRSVADRARDWWDLLLAPWQSQLGRDQFDVDVLGHLHRLETRVTELEKRQP